MRVYSQELTLMRKKSWKVDNVMLCYAIKILLNMQEIPLK